MKVLLVKPYSPFPTRIPHLGLGYLAAALRRAGHEADIADCPREKLNRQGLSQVLARKKPDLLGVSVFSADVPTAREILQDARRLLPECRRVVGGPHPTCLPEHCFAVMPDLEYLLAGEAEESLVQLADGLARGRLDPATVPGLGYPSDGRIRLNPHQPPADLDALALPAWDLLRPELQDLAPHGAFVRNLPVAPILTTRGCPYACTFCAARHISGCRIRARSVENILSEVDFLVHEYGIRELHIEDDNFTFRRECVSAFCEALLRRDYRLAWCCPNGVRLDSLDPGLLALMRRAGCYSLSLGIESGSDAVLERIRKGLDTRVIRRQVAMIHESGIKTTGFFIIGFPGETRGEIEQTVQFALSLPLDRAQFSTFLPLPGTVHFDEYVRFHPLESIPWDHFYTTDVIFSPAGITTREMRRLQRRAFLRFYRRPAVIRGILGEIRGPAHLYHLLRRALAVFS